MNRGDIWWTDFDPSIGSETQKTRPAVIVSNDLSNRKLARVVVVPMTSNTTRLYRGEALVEVGGQWAKAMADQITTVDKSRLKSRLGKLSTADLLAVEQAIKVHLEL